MKKEVNKELIKLLSKIGMFSSKNNDSEEQKPDNNSRPRLLGKDGRGDKSD